MLTHCSYDFLALTHRYVWDWAAEGPMPVAGWRKDRSSVYWPWQGPSGAKSSISTCNNNLQWCPVPQSGEEIPQQHRWATLQDTRVTRDTEGTPGPYNDHTEQIQDTQEKAYRLWEQRPSDWYWLSIILTLSHQIQIDVLSMSIGWSLLSGEVLRDNQGTHRVMHTQTPWNTGSFLGDIQGHNRSCFWYKTLKKHCYLGEGLVTVLNMSGTMYAQPGREWSQGYN